MLAAGGLGRAPLGHAVHRGHDAAQVRCRALQHPEQHGGLRHLPTLSSLLTFCLHSLEVVWV